MFFAPHSAKLGHNNSLQPTVIPLRGLSAAELRRYAAMEIIYPLEPSTLQAAFTAPAVTPIIAIPLVALLPGAYASPLELLVAIPVVIILSLVYGYVGMFFVCLPILGLLQVASRLNAIRLCLYTTLLGAALWTWYYQWNQAPDLERSAKFLIVGAGCSFAVSATFCWLSGITVRSSGHACRRAA